MNSSSRSFPAQLLDGRSAVPVIGVARLDGGELFFIEELGTTLHWPVGRASDVADVAGEVHVTLPPLDPRLPVAKLTVCDPSFRAVLDQHQAQFAPGPLRAAKRVGRGLGIRGWLTVAAVVLPLTFVSYSILLPRLHVFVSVEHEEALGEAVFRAVSTTYPAHEDEEFVRVIEGMLEELRDPVLEYDLRVSLVHLDQINAFALPGGRIVIFSGLIKAAPSANALAGVLAHEIAHVEGRHSLKHILRALGLLQFASSAVGGSLEGFELAETIIELSSGALILKNSRDQEKRADAVAVQKLHAAGRSARGLAEFFEVMDEELGSLPEAMQWISTHPLSSKRIEHVRSLTQDDGPGRPWMSPDEWAEFQGRF